MDRYDLLGDPVPDNHGERGRPAHVPTQENRNKFMLLLAMNWSDEQIAVALRISVPTLRKHYFSQLKAKARDRQAVARTRARAALADMLWERAKTGDVRAIQQFRAMIDRADPEMIEREYLRQAGVSESEQAKAQARQRVGKKERAAEDAQTAGVGTEWGNDLLPNLGGGLN